MKKKDLEKHFKADRWNGGYLLFSKEEGSGRRIVYKYLCFAKKDGKGLSVEGNKPTTSIETLIHQVDEHVKSLPYDSEYYLPLYRKGTFEEFIIRDYLHEIGFKWTNRYDNYESFSLEKKNIYGGKGVDVNINIKNLSSHSFKDAIPDEVSIALFTSQFSWMEVISKREVESIKKAIDTLLKPLMLSNSVDSFVVSEKMNNVDKNIDIELNQISKNLDHYSVSFKKELKEKMMKLVESL